MPRSRKVVILGGRCVGKTAISHRFVEETFPEQYIPTVITSLEKLVEFRGILYRLNIVDTAGMDKFDRFLESHSVGVDGYLLVYSIDNRESLEDVRAINEKILNATFGCSIPRVLVANKVDLSHREVSEDQGVEAAQSFECPFCETSARTDFQIQLAFEKLLARMADVDDPQQPRVEGEKCVFL